VLSGWAPVRPDDYSALWRILYASRSVSVSVFQAFPEAEPASVSASRRRRRVLPLVTMAQRESDEALRNSWASWWLQLPELTVGPQGFEPWTKGL